MGWIVEYLNHTIKSRVRNSGEPCGIGRESKSSGYGLNLGWSWHQRGLSNRSKSERIVDASQIILHSLTKLRLFLCHLSDICDVLFFLLIFILSFLVLILFV